MVVYCSQCSPCFISVLYVFIDVRAFDTNNKDYLRTYLLTYLLTYFLSFFLSVFLSYLLAYLLTYSMQQSGTTSPGYLVTWSSGFVLSTEVVLCAGCGSCGQRRSSESSADDRSQKTPVGEDVGRAESSTWTESSDVSVLLRSPSGTDITCITRMGTIFFSFAGLGAPSLGTMSQTHYRRSG